MKGRILAGALSVSLLLTGCASMLTREYGSVEPHSATLVSEGDANTLRAESYQDVVNGLIYFINRGAESGSIRFDGEEPGPAGRGLSGGGPGGPSGGVRGGVHQIQCGPHCRQL